MIKKQNAKITKTTNKTLKTIKKTSEQDKNVCTVQVTVQD